MACAGIDFCRLFYGLYFNLTRTVQMFKKHAGNASRTKRRNLRRYGL